MSFKITLHDLEERAKGHVGVHYLTVYTVMKGVTLANAAYTLFTVFGSGLGKWELLPFWLASFAALILTYDAVMVGLLIVAWIPKWQDISFPFILAIVEFLLFSTLQSKATSTYWFLAFAIFCSIAGAVVWNVLSKMNLQNYESTLSKLVENYRSRMRRDRFFSLACAVFWFIIFLLTLKLIIPQQWWWVLGIIGLLQTMMAVRGHEHDRQVIIEQISRLTKG